MFKFFRAIRQRLLHEGKLSAYFTYAIGEIILVVIGILIALQINTWTNNIQIRELEQATLAELGEALKLDLVSLDKNIDILDRKILDNKELLSHLEEQRPYEKKLDRLMMNVYVHRGYKTINTSAFELLKERGFDLIKNADLRKKITTHYTTDLADIYGMLSRVEKLNMIQADNIYDNFLLFRDHEADNSSVRAFDYDKLLNDPRISAPFYHFEMLSMTYSRNLSRLKEKTESVLAAIEAELALKD